MEEGWEVGERRTEEEEERRGECEEVVVRLDVTLAGGWQGRWQGRWQVGGRRVAGGWQVGCEEGGRVTSGCVEVEGCEEKEESPYAMFVK